MLSTKELYNENSDTFEIKEIMHRKMFICSILMDNNTSVFWPLPGCWIIPLTAYAYKTCIELQLILITQGSLDYRNISWMQTDVKLSVMNARNGCFFEKVLICSLFKQHANYGYKYKIKKIFIKLLPENWVHSDKYIFPEVAALYILALSNFTNIIDSLQHAILSQFSE